MSMDPIQDNNTKNSPISNMLSEDIELSFMISDNDVIDLSTKKHHCH